jgi:hypothetical protein
MPPLQKKRRCGLIDESSDLEALFWDSVSATASVDADVPAVPAGDQGGASDAELPGLAVVNHSRGTDCSSASGNSSSSSSCADASVPAVPEVGHGGASPVHLPDLALDSYNCTAHCSRANGSSSSSSSSCNSSSSCSSSSSSSSSGPNNDSLASSSAEDTCSDGDGDLFADEGDSSDDDLPVDRFSDLKTAQTGESYMGHTVHFWTFPWTSKAGANTAANTTKKQLARILRAVYGAAVLVYYVIVKEMHAFSKRSWERKPHFHVLLKLTRRVKWLAIAKDLRARDFYGRLSIPTRHSQYWHIFSYIYVPSLKKPLTELDPDPFLSSSFPVDELEKKFKKALFAKQQVRAWDFFQVLRKLGAAIRSYQDLVAWADLQRKRGLPEFEKFLVRQGPKMLPLFRSWQMLLVKPLADGGQRAARLAVWLEALSAPCLCVTAGRLREALQSALEFHGKNTFRFAWMVKRMVRIGTAAKNANILLYGESNSGKTGLTRPLIFMFGDACWVRPNAGDTFPLEGLESKLFGVWQDWRVNQTPVPWDTLLLVLEGESVQAAAKGAPSVLVHTTPPMFITTQTQVVPKNSHGLPDEAERMAFVNRFCLRWKFKKALPPELKDPLLKLCYCCTGCYSRWIEENAAEWSVQDPDAEQELRVMEQAMDSQQAAQQQAYKARLSTGPGSSDGLEAPASATPLTPQQWSPATGAYVPVTP